MLKYNIHRQSILAERENFSARQYAEKIAAFGQEGASSSSLKRNTQYSIRNTRGVPLAIIGGPLMRQEFRIFDIVEESGGRIVLDATETVEESGGRIVLDATETGERGMCSPLDTEGLREDPLRNLSKAYFSGIPDASRRPDSELYDWFEQKLTERDVEGIIFRRYMWCDMWHAQLRRLKDLVDLPVLDIDTAGDFDSEHNRTAGRIRAFLEMLQ
jgi:benzoyl-CoA reductase/2-hydroxyglutaryl-CoA dehydratase subunit BcrC/BadD/HgdB